MLDKIEEEIIVNLDKIEELITNTKALRDLRKIERTLASILRLTNYVNDKLDYKFYNGDFDEKDNSKDKS
jgi:hypothetical protein